MLDLVTQQRRGHPAQSATGGQYPILSLPLQLRVPRLRYQVSMSRKIRNFNLYLKQKTALFPPVGRNVEHTRDEFIMWIITIRQLPGNTLISTTAYQHRAKLNQLLRYYKILPRHLNSLSQRIPRQMSLSLPLTTAVVTSAKYGR